MKERSVGPHHCPTNPVAAIRVKLAPDGAPEQRERMGRCLELFEDFCIVTESIRQGVQVDVQVDAVPAVTHV